MKRKIFVFVIATFMAIGNVNAQSDDEEFKIWDFDEWQKNIVVFPKVDMKPEFIGGDKALFQYFENAIEVPDSIQIIYISMTSRVFCAIDIDDNGKITNVDLNIGTLERSGWFSGGFYCNCKRPEDDCPYCKRAKREGLAFDFIENQILALVENMPIWTPAKKNGINIESTINFAIQYDIVESVPNIYFLDGKEITEDEFWDNMELTNVIKRNQLLDGKRVNIAYLTTLTEQ